MDNKTRANQIFAANPKQEIVFIASDGLGFFDEHKANDHQRKLGNGKLESFAFKDSEFGKEVANRTGGQYSQTKSDGPKDLKDMNFNELKEVAKAKDVDIKGLKSKADVRAAILAKESADAKNLPVNGVQEETGGSSEGTNDIPDDEDSQKTDAGEEE